MDWCKLSARYYLDKAIAQQDDAGEVMFTRALAYAADQEEGGFIPAGMLHVFSRSRRYEATAGALVAAGLWLPVRGGYQITRWEEWQSELEAIARRRSADRDRKRRTRAAAKAAQTNPNGAVDNPPSRDNVSDANESFEHSKNPPGLHVRGQSADIPQESFSSLSSGTGGIESKKDPPNPPQAGGHAGQHSNCRACGTNPRGPTPPPIPTPTPPPVADVLGTNGQAIRGRHVETIAAEARKAITRKDT